MILSALGGFRSLFVILVTYFRTNMILFRPQMRLGDLSILTKVFIACHNFMFCIWVVESKNGQSIYTKLKLLFWTSKLPLDWSDDDGGLQSVVSDRWVTYSNWVFMLTFEKDICADWGQNGINGSAPEAWYKNTNVCGKNKQYITHDNVNSVQWLKDIVSAVKKKYVEEKKNNLEQKIVFFETNDVKTSENIIIKSSRSDFSWSDLFFCPQIFFFYLFDQNLSKGTEKIQRFRLFGKIFFTSAMMS